MSDIYASPIFKAKKGSTHGYDVVDSNEINPELGAVQDFDTLHSEMQKRGMGWIQDIVPNHMAIDYENQMLSDVLENGPNSEYLNFFDIEWDHPYESIKGRLLAPFLGKFYGECLESGEIQLRYDQNGFTVNYYELRFPLKVTSYGTILRHRLNSLKRKIGRDHPDFIKLLGILYSLKTIETEDEIAERYSEWYCGWLRSASCCCVLPAAASAMLPFAWAQSLSERRYPETRRRPDLRRMG